MLPHLAGRPLNLERYPDGIHGQRIIQQRAGTHFPAWICRVTVPKELGTVRFARQPRCGPAVPPSRVRCGPPVRAGRGTGRGGARPLAAYRRAA
ncbi:hypothetical protein [Pseudofrankia sp. BMG5.37]|uniref:non-homologous end-joining DNA ligase LigD n=1 Tax=Pseudofrankia sp. BMG5.37 TaxID=3050035 RepID=UPI0037C7257D